MVENLVYSIVPVITMIIGFYFGYKIRAVNKEDKLPDIKAPSTIIREHKEIKEAQKKIDEATAWIDEINNYNGEFGE